MLKPLTFHLYTRARTHTEFIVALIISFRIFEKQLDLRTNAILYQKKIVFLFLRAN